ncbi:hypothetical protein [Bacillus massilinigeriensis]|uniref:hypothetical protein n=1 Tax=Bacillus massilionigeriensis TaxID=1805475 RepID=UPI001F20D488|nr:hypothetical protein [Bacillus massilionigeriensis]
MLALQHYPEERKKLEARDDKYVQMFVQEARWYYPFFPFVEAFVKKEFTWNSFKFEENT